MYGLFALEVYGLDALQIGYAVCLGALTLICTNIWITCPLQRRLGQVPCAALGMTLMSCGELGLAFLPSLELSLLGMLMVYAGQAVAGCTMATITSTLSTDESRGNVMSMQQTAQALGRVVGPLCLGQISNANPRWPFALAAATTFAAAILLFTLDRAYRHTLGEYTPVHLPSPSWVPQGYTDEDVEELGRFLCELLTEGHYRWHGPEQRAALKIALRICFPPINVEDPNAVDMRTVLASRTGGGGIEVRTLPGVTDGSTLGQ